MNYVDFIVEKTLSHIPDTSKGWAISNALATIQTVMDKYRLYNRWGIVRANDNYCNIGMPGSGKSIVPTNATIPVIKKVEDSLECLNPDTPGGPRKSILLPIEGSSEGFMSYMSTNKLSFGLLDLDEISKLMKGTKKSYKSDAIEFLSTLWDGRDFRSATTSRGYEFVDSPFISMLACSTHIFVENIDEGFFRQGFGNRIVWSWLNSDEVSEKNPSTFFYRGGKTGQEWHEEISDKLCSIYKNKPIYMMIDDAAAKRWVNYDTDCLKRWVEAGNKDPSGWEFQPINRFPLHALKTSMIYAMGSKRNILLVNNKSLELQPVVEDEHMKKAIDFMRLSECDFNTLVNWKIRHSGRRIIDEDYSVIAKKYIYKIKDMCSGRIVFMKPEIQSRVSRMCKDDKITQHVIDAMYEMTLITYESKSHFTEKEQSEMGWPDDKRYNSMKAVRILI